MAEQGDLIATCWTIAGNVVPGSANDLSPFALERRLAAAAEAGYTGVGFWHGDLQQYLRRGSFRQLRQLLNAYGILNVELEYLGDWFATGARRRNSDAMRQDLFAAADALGARHIKVVPPFGENWPQQRLIDEFGGLCAEAAPHDLLIALEMIPYSDAGTLDVALDIVVGADADNGGLLVDIWHVARSGASFEEILRIPAKYLCAAEINDANAAIIGSLAEDSMHHRKLCGEGQFDLHRFVACMRQAGYSGPFGVEVLSDELRSKPLAEVAQSSFSTASQYVRS